MATFSNSSTQPAQLIPFSLHKLTEHHLPTLLHNLTHCPPSLSLTTPLSNPNPALALTTPYTALLSSPLALSSPHSLASLAALAPYEG